MAGLNSASLNGADQLLLPPEAGLRYLRLDRAGEIELSPGAVAFRDGRVAALEPDAAAELQVDARGCSVIPGLIDAHTHLPFAGWRASEYELKIAGMAYEDIAGRGGGIQASARAWAEASDAQILALATELTQEMVAWGTTAFETKSGYGLSVAAEERALMLSIRLGEQADQNTVSTALLAHAVPDGFSPDEWMDEVEGMLPAVASDTAARALDIYVESVAFTNAHLERMGALAADVGLDLRCHVEQFATHRSVPVALAAGAKSVDHLACLDPRDLAPLAKSECAAVLLPGAEFLGQERLAPARELADAGAVCVLATDANPGTSPIVALPVIIGLAVRRYAWTATEALVAATLNAAWVLGMSHERGTIEPGKRADLVLLDGPIETVPYRFGHNPVVATFIDGVPRYVRPGDQWRFRS
ncbi:MAG: imidazolonepropionase [Thermomicrobiales bacterium]